MPPIKGVFKVTNPLKDEVAELLRANAFPFKKLILSKDKKSLLVQCENAETKETGKKLVKKHKQFRVHQGREVGAAGKPTKMFTVSFAAIRAKEPRKKSWAQDLREKIEKEMGTVVKSCGLMLKTGIATITFHKNSEYEKAKEFVKKDPTYKIIEPKRVPASSEGRLPLALCQRNKWESICEKEII